MQIMATDSRISKEFTGAFVPEGPTAPLTLGLCWTDLLVRCVVVRVCGGVGGWVLAIMCPVLWVQPRQSAQNHLPVILARPSRPRSPLSLSFSMEIVTRT